MLAFGSTLEEKYTRYEVFYIPMIILVIDLVMRSNMIALMK